MELEHCCECDAETGKAGISDGSLYASSDRGPYCESCWDEVPHKLAEQCDDYEAEITRLEAPLDQAPDYQRVKRAMSIANAEYVGQSWLELWVWAWEETSDA